MPNQLNPELIQLAKQTLLRSLFEIAACVDELDDLDAAVIHWSEATRAAIPTNIPDEFEDEAYLVEAESQLKDAIEALVAFKGWTVEYKERGF